MTAQALIVVVVVFAIAFFAAAVSAWRLRRKVGLLRGQLATLEQARRRDLVLLQEARRQIEQMRPRPGQPAAPSHRPAAPVLETVARPRPAPFRQAEGSFFFGRNEAAASDFRDTQILDGFDETRIDER